MPRLRASRRRFLAASLAVALAGGCGGGGGNRPTTTARPGSLSPTGRPSRTPTATATPTPAPRGFARLEAPRTLTFDTFDAARAGELAVLEVLGRTYSRLLEYRQFEPPEIGGDLAERWEQPDELTVVLQLSPRARWQDGPPVSGRAVTAEDAAASLRRTIELAASVKLPALQRPQDWAAVESAQTLDDGTLRLTLARPDPFIINTLAGAFAFIQAPEALEMFDALDGQAELSPLAGSGPFRFDKLGDEAELVLSAFDGGHRPPRLSGLTVGAPVDGVARFRAGEIDQVTAFDRRDGEELDEDAGGPAIEFTRLAETPVMTSFYVGAPPWSDRRLREAIWLALDPRELISRLAGGLGDVVVPRVLAASRSALGLSERDVEALLPAGTDNRSRARALWEEGGGPSLGTVMIDFPNVFEPRYSASSVVTDLLAEALGDQFRPAVEPYTTISQKTLEHEYGNGRAAFWFGWGPPFIDPEPARQLWETYASSGPNFAATGFASEAVDAALGRLLAAPTADGREDLLGEALLAIAGEFGGGVMPWFTQALRVFRRPGLERVAPSPWWDQHFEHLTSFDAERMRP